MYFLFPIKQFVVVVVVTAAADTVVVVVAVDQIALQNLIDLYQFRT